MSHTLGVEVPESVFSPFPHEAVDLLQRAEKATAAVPRIPELIGYGIRVVRDPVLINGHIKVPNFLLRYFIDNYELPADLVSYDDPVKNTTNIIVPNSPCCPSSLRQRIRLAKEHAADATSALLSRAHFVAAVIADSYGFTSLRERHQSFVDPDDLLAFYNFRDTEDPEKVRDNDHNLLLAITYPTPIEDTVLGRKVAELINDPELSLIAYSELYMNGDFESFDSMMNQARKVLLEPECLPERFMSEDVVGEITDWLEELALYANENSQHRQWSEIEELKLRFELSVVNAPGRNLLQHISSRQNNSY